MKVQTIVREWLEGYGYDGLFTDECSCQNSDLMPCDSEGIHACEPGYKVDAKEDDPEGHDFYIMATKDGDPYAK